MHLRDKGYEAVRWNELVRYRIQCFCYSVVIETLTSYLINNNVSVLIITYEIIRYLRFIQYKSMPLDCL